MFRAVQTSFRAFNEPIEGSISYMYVDVKQLVTIGVGNLIDPIEVALELPFRWKNKPGVTKAGAPATRDEITAEWNRIKKDTSLARRGHTACEPITNLELSAETIDGLIMQKLQDNEAFLKRHPEFKTYESWPADAQLGVLSMAWALGPGGVLAYPRFLSFCAAGDFQSAAGECGISEVGNAGVAPRNRANQILFRNAAAVIAGESRGDFERSVLYYPRVLGRAT